MAIKKTNPHILLLVKVVDFYEAFGNDAHAISKVLGLTITVKNDIAMVGFHTNMYLYIGRLIREGYLVSIVHSDALFFNSVKCSEILI